MADKSLRDYFHELMNKIQGIAVNSGGFAYLYGHYPDKIDSTTRGKLSTVIKDLEAYYDNTFKSLSLTSQAVGKSVASKEWVSVQKAIGKELNDIYEILDSVKDMGAKISESGFKNDILNITKEMSLFQEKCESVARIIENFKERLISLGIYDDVYS